MTPEVLHRLEALERRVAQLADMVEESTQILAEQLAHLRSEVTDELFPRLTPTRPCVSPEAAAALERLERIRRRAES